LIDFGPYNTLLHFKDTKTASLDVQTRLLEVDVFGTHVGGEPLGAESFRNACVDRRPGQRCEPAVSLGPGRRPK
jgi:hypothetical protein